MRLRGAPAEACLMGHCFEDDGGSSITQTGDVQRATSDVNRTANLRVSKILQVPATQIEKCRNSQDQREHDQARKKPPHSPSRKHVLRSARLGMCELSFGFSNGGFQSLQIGGQHAAAG